MKIESACIPHPAERGTYLLFLELTADEQESAERKPIHLVLAIDASSSMGGPRLTCAVEAARAVVDRLGPSDMFCLLAFDRSVRTLFGPGLVDGAARAAIHRALFELKPGVGTALLAAVERSHEMLRRVFVRQTRPHAIVLTDGYPSFGPCDPPAFAAVARKAADEGLVTSAVGIGLDFDENCLGALVEAGGGRYSFVDKESDIPGALARHLSDLFAVAHEGATVRVSPAGAVREAALLHRYPTKVSSDGFVVETGPIGRGAPRRLLFTLKSAGEPSPMAKIALTVKGEPREPDRILTAAVDPRAALGPEAHRELYRLSLATREGEFWDAVHRNDRPTAERAHTGALDAVNALERCGAPAPEIGTDKARLADQKSVLDGRLSEEAREAARKRSHHTAISRVTSIFELE
jgi:hypothetical protein